jgi:hypothetical protein
LVRKRQLTVGDSIEEHADRKEASQHAQETRSLLMRANALIDETGAKAYEAMMLRVRSLIGDARD